MLMEHGGIGRAFGKGDLAHDVRLACHGLDPNDNDFVAGLVGDSALRNAARLEVSSRPCDRTRWRSSSPYIRTTSVVAV